MNHAEATEYPRFDLDGKRLRLSSTYVDLDLVTEIRARDERFAPGDKVRNCHHTSTRGEVGTILRRVKPCIYDVSDPELTMPVPVITSRFFGAEYLVEWEWRGGKRQGTEVDSFLELICPHWVGKDIDYGQTCSAKYFCTHETRKCPICQNSKGAHRDC